MECRNCGRKLSIDQETIVLSETETTLRVCSGCWTWTEELPMKG